MNKAALIEAYRETGKFYESAQAVGMTLYAAHLALAEAGILKISDKIEYGPGNAKKGGLAERRFLEIFPEAADANYSWKKNNPGFDFCLWEMTVDVKYSSISRRHSLPLRSWKVQAKSRPDFFVCFLESEEGKGMEGCFMLAIPSAFISVKKCLRISETGPVFNNFRVSPEEARKLFERYAAAGGGEVRGTS